MTDTAADGGLKALAENEKSARERGYFGSLPEGSPDPDALTFPGFTGSGKTGPATPTSKAPKS